MVVRVGGRARREGQAAPRREGGVGRGDALELRGAPSEVGVGPAGRGEVGAADLSECVWGLREKGVGGRG